MNGAPGNVPPVMSHPSSEWTWASYQATGPSHGWCEFTLRRVTPSVARAPASACALDPEVGAGGAGKTGAPACGGASLRSTLITLSIPSMSGSLCANPSATSRPV